VASRKVSSLTVKDGLAGKWLRDCGPDLGHAVVAKFFYQWHVLANVQLASEREDGFVWRWSANGSFSASSSYKALSSAVLEHRRPNGFGGHGIPTLASSLSGSSLGTDVGRLTGCKGLAFVF
jgi:hypothetical protein